MLREIVPFFELFFQTLLRTRILTRTFASEEPRSNSCGASSIPMEEDNCSRLLTPKQASGNAQTLGFIEQKGLSKFCLGSLENAYHAAFFFR